MQSTALHAWWNMWNKSNHDNFIVVKNLKIHNDLFLGIGRLFKSQKNIWNQFNSKNASKNQFIINNLNNTNNINII